MDNLYLVESPVSRIHPLYASQVQHIFGVRGERRQIAVVQGDSVDNFVKGQPQDAQVSCTPLIPYEQFARETLNVLDSEVEKKGTTPPFVKGQNIYWLRVNVGYIGHTLDELLKAWHDEAVAALGLVHGGQVPIAIYKSVAMREVHLFIQIEAGALDKISFTLPIIKPLGDQLSIVTKAVRLCEA